MQWWDKSMSRKIPVFYLRKKGENMEKGFSSEGSQKKVSPGELPFDCSAELGEILSAERKSPGVYHLGTAKGDDSREFYVVTEDAPAISAKARSYGQVLNNHRELRVYVLCEPSSGWHIIDFEVCRYQMLRRLSGAENSDFLYVSAIYGAEEHPDYFGGFPVPMYTPRGYTVRHKEIRNGVYWLETDRCEEMLSICYPIWKTDLTPQEKDLGSHP